MDYDNPLKQIAFDHLKQSTEDPAVNDRHIGRRKWYNRYYTKNTNDIITKTI